MRQYLLSVPILQVHWQPTEISQVCALGYTVIGLALLLFVQAKDVFPHLLLARLFFSIGGAAASTMVTAILPSMTAPREDSDEANLSRKTPDASNAHGFSPSISSELTVTPLRLNKQSILGSPSNGLTPTRLAGIVGIFTGCGALLALGFFLRLPELIERRGTSPGQALADSYYIVGALSLILALSCFLGLRNLHGEDDKGWRNLVYGNLNDPISKTSSLNFFAEAVALGFKNPLLGLGYLGGFVARASVRISVQFSSSVCRLSIAEHILEPRGLIYPLNKCLEITIYCPTNTNGMLTRSFSPLQSRSSFLYLSTNTTFPLDYAVRQGMIHKLSKRIVEKLTSLPPSLRAFRNL